MPITRGTKAAGAGIFWGGGKRYLLDKVSGAVGAYSLRKLRKAHSGAVVRVRRSSDNSEQDFIAAEVADGTLESFCGAGDGFVRWLYDQSGNDNDAGNATAAEQPKIVSSGSLVTQNGKPSINVDGADDYLAIDALASSFSGADKPISVLSVHQIKSGADRPTCLVGFHSSTDATPLIELFPDTRLSESEVYKYQRRDDANTLKNPSASLTEASLVVTTSVDSGAAIDLYEDGTQLITAGDVDVGATTLDLGTISA